MPKSETPPKESSTESTIAMPNHGVVGVYRNTHQLFVANIMGGIAWGLGTVIGATVMVAVVIFLLTSLGGLPIIGDYLSELAKEISNSVTQ